MNEDIRKMIDKVKNFKQFVNENYNIKYGVDFVYNQHPNLSEIGTKEQYSKYIDTIFPNSMNKNIWFHGTNVNPNEIKSLRPSKSGTYGFGIYLQSHTGKYHTGTFGDNTISVIVDVNKIYDFDKYGNELIKKLKEKYDDLEKTGNVMVALQNTIKKEGYDSIIVSSGCNTKYLLLMDTSKTFMGPSNHHILGSEKDIENFKLYMSKSDEMRRIIDDFNKFIIKENMANIDIPKYLYHATFKPLLKKIKSEGLGGVSANQLWSFSKKGVVCLAKDGNVAYSYAETGFDENDDIPESWGEKIIILVIDTEKLDRNKIHLDRNVLDNDGDTFEYHGIIPFDTVVNIMTEDDLYKQNYYT